MEILLKANKQHKCGQCEISIAKGEKHLLIKMRYPVYQVIPGYDKSNPDAPEKQTGIKFMRWRQHNYDCWAPFECQIGNHDFEYHDGMRGDEFIHSPLWACKHCGKTNNAPKPDMYDLQEIELKEINRINKATPK